MTARVLYVAGSGRSGSTLLDRLLDRHPRIVGLGEVHRLSLDPDERRCGCGETIRDCPFWSVMIEALVERESLDPSRWEEAFPTTVVRERRAEGARDLGLLEATLLIGSRRVLSAAGRVSPSVAAHLEVARNSWRLYDTVADATGAGVVVDSTKNAGRLKLLYLQRPASLRVVHLVRDGRAVASSARRRTNATIRDAATIWRRANRNVELACRTIPADRVLRVRYEDLCNDVTGEMRRLCAFVGLEPSDEIFSLEPCDYHQIPGNPMLFRSRETEIVRDDRWRDTFDASDQREFDDVAGAMNRRYGYD